MNHPASAATHQVGHLINGSVVTRGDTSIDIHNPATGETCGQVSLATPQDVGDAIAAAKAAFVQWRAVPPAKRARIMFNFKRLLEDNAQAIAEVVTREHGKVGSDALGEIQRGIENVEYACYAPELLKGQHNKNVGPDIDTWSEMHPLGVVAGISPFNFPVMVPLWMWPLAVVCGNCFILKPSERDPTAALMVASLAQEAGLPPGVLNVVNGDKTAVDTLLRDPDVQAVSFVGSTPVAEYVYREGTAHGKRVQALGGAKNHAIVLPDADLDNAVGALMGAAYGSCGERCMAISVVVAVGDTVADQLTERLKPALAELKVGVGDDESNAFGPLITRQQLDRVTQLVASGVADGAELVVDGRQVEVADCPDGYFLGPCLFDQVRPGMRIYDEEIFGPVLCIVRVNNMAEAMQLVNDHEYGNGACLFTRDGEAARYFTDTVSAGMVGVNVALPVPVSVHSFGGWKRSLFGDLHAYGPDGVRFYTRRKTVTQRWPASGALEGAVFSFPSNA